MRLDLPAPGLTAATLCAILVACGSSPSQSQSADSGLSTDDASGASSQIDAGTSGGFRVCWRLDDAPDCFTCCMANFPVAQKKLLAAAAKCTCSSAYCGPPGDGGSALDAAGTDAAPTDAGARDAAAADAGLVAQNACGAAMCSLTAAPSQACLQCVLGVMEGVAGAPLCPESTAACNSDPECAPLLGCAVNCPGTVMD